MNPLLFISIIAVCAIGAFTKKHFSNQRMILRQLSFLIHNQIKTIMADLSKLQADVTANNEVVQSAVTLLQGLKAQLDAAGTDPQKLADLSASLEASTQALAAAVAANTPAAPQV